MNQDRHYKRGSVHRREIAQTLSSPRDRDHCLPARVDMSAARGRTRFAKRRFGRRPSAQSPTSRSRRRLVWSASVQPAPQGVRVNARWRHLWRTAGCLKTRGAQSRNAPVLWFLHVAASAAEARARTAMVARIIERMVFSCCVRTLARTMPAGKAVGLQPAPRPPHGFNPRRARSGAHASHAQERVESSRASTTFRMTLRQSPGAGWRKRRRLGYQGLSSRFSNQRQQVS